MDTLHIKSESKQRVIIVEKFMPIRIKYRDNNSASAQYADRVTDNANSFRRRLIRHFERHLGIIRINLNNVSCW
jgi:hypothetical protein